MINEQTKVEGPIVSLGTVKAEAVNEIERVIHEQGYKVTVTRVSQRQGKFHSCWPVRWMAEQEARSIIKADPMVEAVRVYSRNRVEFLYGIFVCLRLVRDLGGIMDETGGESSMGGYYGR